MFQLFVDNISGAWCLGLILTKQKVYAFRKIFILRVCNFHNVHANAQGFLKADGQKIVNEREKMFCCVALVLLASIAF